MGPRMIPRVKHFAFIFLWLTIVLAAPSSQPEASQNGALGPKSNLNHDASKQILPRDAPSVATKDGPPGSSKIAAVKEPGEKEEHSPQTFGFSIPASNSAGQKAQKESKEPAKDNPAPKNGSPQRQKDGSVVDNSTPDQDSKQTPTQGQFSQGNEPAVGRVPKNPNSSPPSAQQEKPPKNQPDPATNLPPTQEQVKPETKKEKEKPKIIYMPMPKIQLFGRPHEGQQEYIAVWALGLVARFLRGVLIEGVSFGQGICLQRICDVFSTARIRMESL